MSTSDFIFQAYPAHERQTQTIEHPTIDPPTLILSGDGLAFDAFDGASALNKSQFQTCMIRLKLQANNTDYVFDLKVGEKLAIGREMFGDSLTVNTSLMGISRQHLVIMNEGMMLTVMDLNSTNGTRLNQMPLTPYQKRILRFGDSLQLSSLTIKVQVYLVER